MDHTDFRYDPFDAAVMANPLPYYRILRDQHPVYYMPQWDTFALSRFEDIWKVLEVNNGTFVASEGTLPAASVLAQHNSGPVDDPPLHPLPFHAMFDADLYGEIRRTHSRPFRPRSVTDLEGRIRELANERLDLLLPRGSFDLTQDYGGVVVAAIVCELLGIPTDLAPQVLAAVNAGSLAQPGVGVDTGQARPNYFEFLLPAVARRRADRSGPPLDVVDGLLGYHLPDGSALDDMEVATQMLCIFIGGTETVPKIVAHGLWELSRRPDQLAAVRADPEGNVPVAREEMIRYCAPAQWFARTARKPFDIHGQTINPGQRVITLLASASRDEREYPEPDEFIWDRPIRRSLAFGRGQHFCIGYHLARLEIDVLLAEWLRRVPDYAIQTHAATRLPSSFQWGWNNIPVEV
ncbi:cytochrome P450 [Mycobacterium intracellulare]|uniref:Cytochrome P450 superfamily protein n=1 Tax=Mycobacterium intracellulare (strain ATCC 13950 / DSM 43223 / JCM 6384 / NCTC 13025 / 3600) TaxID=487521 RepID=H8IIE7_MYCIA|nr:cytochrome P450 [Mycobacterium intracellulare]AFC46160.1 cytochrome P450 superfamily protein [Mycobacterium intracellulare ATCC 13950]MCA2253960.1 cytochrome P450 [Mycobacterium intracellulare]MCA2304585.1 cytochrome P450 [Mycobacterium intracellulare]MCA2346341.1 cytochrome P450 [Mycobacterium intracellulare]MEE3801609.1 cytochrome P450 [Mycobacterium intracellulare]